MAIATFRFHGELSVFIAPNHRNSVFDYDCARAATIKHAIEALGVPHTEIGRIIVDDKPATLGRIVRLGNVIEVFPYDPTCADAEGHIRFVADAHLGGLARFLRMLGLDTLYNNATSDREIAEIAARENRIVLTRDRELLKRRDIGRGRFVHATKPESQLKEVATRYALGRHMRPFTLCLRCNLPLDTISRQDAAERIPEKVAGQHAEFSRCPGCRRIYWKGSHWTRMREMLSLFGSGPTDTRHCA